MSTTEIFYPEFLKNESTHWRERMDNLLAKIERGDLPGPVKAEAKTHLDRFENDTFVWASALPKTNVREVADGLGVRYLQKETVVQVAKKVAEKVRRDFEREEDGSYAKIRQASINYDVREHAVEEAGRLLRYWASDAVEADDSNVWRGDGAPSVEAMLKHYGKIYCQFRGHDDIVVFTEDTKGGVEVEDALRRIGNYALNNLLTGPGRWYGEQSMVQIRLGDLMPTMYQDLGLRIIVRLTHGALDHRRPTEIAVSYDDASEYAPRWSGKERTAFDALQP